MSAPSFKPTICPESIKIHQESNKGDFLQRVARDAAKKEHEAVRKQVQNSDVAKNIPVQTQRKIAIHASGDKVAVVVENGIFYGL